MTPCYHEYLEWFESEDIYVYQSSQWTDWMLKKYQHRDSNIFLYLTGEYEFVDAKINLIEMLSRSLKKQHTRRKLFLIVNQWYLKDLIPHAHKFCVDDILSIDTMLMLPYKTVCLNSPCHTVAPTKFLCLTGRSYPLNRFGLLYLLAQHDLLQDHGIWSLFPPENFQQLIKNAQHIHPDISEREIKIFCEKFAGSPDHAVSGHALNYGLPGIEILYKNSSFSVIAEAEFQEPSVPELTLTEKTWRSIYHYHPFIMAGPTGALKKLKSLGFETFEEFLPKADYDTIQDPVLRLHAIVENVKYWIYHIDHCVEKLTELVTHNRQILDNYYHYNTNKIRDFIAKHRLELSPDDLKIFPEQSWSELSQDCKFIPAVQEKSDFTVFYNNVKDPSWPDCDNQEDFHRLPEYIKHECTTVFGYDPENGSCVKK